MLIRPPLHSKSSGIGRTALFALKGVFKVKKRISIIALASFLALGGCVASGADPKRIAIVATADARFPSDHPFAGKTSLGNVQGGSNTNPLWMSNISDTEFESGLLSSLRSAGLLAENQSNAQYRMVANLQDLKRPLVGLDMSVTMTVRYTISPLAGGAPVFDEVVSVVGTATMGEAFAGAKRLQLANEKAANANITEMLRRVRAKVPSGSIAPTS
jgi:hypothetical protein